MRLASRPAIVAVCAATVLLSLPAAVQAHAGSGRAAQAYPPGFQVDLSGGAHVECWVARVRLRCLNYSGAGTSDRCSFGGEVATRVLARRGPMKFTYTCVDEGYHGWRRLRSGARFRSGPFRCRLGSGARTLRCSNDTRTVTIAR